MDAGHAPLYAGETGKSIKKHSFTQFFRRFSVMKIMKKRRFCCFVLLLICCMHQMQAQWDAPFTQQWAARSFYNPSFNGETEQITTSAHYRYHWAGIENAPRKLLLTAGMPVEFLHRRHGAGLIAYSENVGELRNTLLAAQYSYIIKTGSGLLHVGLQAGLSDVNYDAGKIVIVTDSLHTVRGSVRVNPAERQVPDINAGISWRGRKVYAGLSVMHINQPSFYAFSDSVSTIDLQTDSLRSVIPRSYIFMAGCNIRLIHPFEIEPMVWVLHNRHETMVQATLRMIYDERFSGGLSWRSNDGYSFFAGVNLQGVEMGYAYDLHKTGMAKVSSGSHELYLRYLIPADYLKPKRQPQKSIRLL